MAQSQSNLAPLVSLSDLQSKNSQDARLGGGNISLQGAPNKQSSLSKLTVGPQSTVASVAGLKSSPQSNVQLPNVSVSQKSGLVQPSFLEGSASKVEKSVVPDASTNAIVPVQPTSTYNQPVSGTSGSVPSPVTSNTNTSTSGLLTYPSLVGGISRQAGTINKTAEQIGAAGQMTPEEVAARQELARLKGETAEKSQNILTHPGVGGFAMGRDAINQRYAQGQESTLAEQISAYAAERAAAQGAYQGQSAAQQGAGGLMGTAAGYAQPVTQFGQLTNPQSGEVVSPSGGNPQLNTAVQQAVQLVQNGATPQDAMSQSGISNFGLPGQQAFTTAMQQVSDGTYNPTQWSAGAQQNASQATATQQQAFTMDTALKQLGTIQPLITNFMTQSGLNSQDNPDFNAAMQTYYGKFLSPGNKQIFETYMGDIQKYTSQILAAGSGTIPTDVSNTLSNFDPRNLTASQLQPYLDSLKKLGDNQLSVLQGQTSATGGTGYTGTPTSVTKTPTVAPTVTPSAITSKNPIIQGLIGGGLNAFGGGVNAATSFFSHVFGK